MSPSTLHNRLAALLGDDNAQRGLGRLLPTRRDCPRTLRRRPRPSRKPGVSRKSPPRHRPNISTRIPTHQLPHQNSMKTKTTYSQTAGITEDQCRTNHSLPEARRDHLPQLSHDLDDIDHEVAGDPIIDSIPQRRHSRGSGRIFRILDQLENTPNRRFTT